MRKTIIPLITLACILLTLCSCSKETNRTMNTDDSFKPPIHGNNDETEKTESDEQSTESNGVPNSLVLRNASIPENVTHEIIHHYDETLHIDDVELITYYNGQYGTRTTTYTYSYQYNRSTDLWSLINEDNGMQSDVIDLSEEKYINNPYFSGNFSQSHKGTYEIKIHDIDFLNKKATIEYLVIFDDYSTLSSTETVDLYTANDGRDLCFLIPYTRSMVVRFELFFKFDIDEGISA